MWNRKNVLAACKHAPKNRACSLQARSLHFRHHSHGTDVLPKIPHSNSCNRVPHWPLRPRQGRVLNGTPVQAPVQVSTVLTIIVTSFSPPISYNTATPRRPAFGRAPSGTPALPVMSSRGDTHAARHPWVRSCLQASLERVSPAAIQVGQGSQPRPRGATCGRARAAADEERTDRELPILSRPTAPAIAAAG